MFIYICNICTHIYIYIYIYLWGPWRPASARGGKGGGAQGTRGEKLWIRFLSLFRSLCGASFSLRSVLIISTLSTSKCFRVQSSRVLVNLFRLTLRQPTLPHIKRPRIRRVDPVHSVGRPPDRACSRVVAGFHSANAGSRYAMDTPT